MQALITGVGDAFTREHFGSSALIRAPRGLVLIDCPDLIHRAVHEASLKARWSVEAVDIDDVIVTHLHGDHSNGLESLGFARAIRRRTNPSLPRVRLHCSEPVGQRVWQKLGPAMDGSLFPDRLATLDDYFDLRVLGENDQVNDVAGLAVRIRYTGHPIPTTGLVISAGGSTLGWSADTPFEQAHIDWLSGADVIVHESNLGPAHTPIEQLNALPDSLRRKMRLIHLTDDFDRAQTDIAILREGDVIDL
jgi:ribonuclease BN (tRNA processing enzyme)